MRCDIRFFIQVIVLVSRSKKKEKELKIQNLKGGKGKSTHTKRGKLP